MDETQQKILQNISILCFIETWVWKDSFEKPNFLSEYKFFNQIAVKEKSLGRGKGGIMIFVKKELDTELVDSCNCWIAIRVKNGQDNLFLIFIYINPNYDILEYLNLLTDLINEINLKYPSPKIIISGDWNARIGMLNDFSDKYDNGLFEGLSLSTHRESLDQITNQRGTYLANSMENLGFYAINGRSTSDCPSQFTYVSSGGKSIIDLTWANDLAMGDIIDFEILEFILSSDHLPNVLILKNYNKKYCTNKIKPKVIFEKLKWNDLDKYNFVEELNLVNSDDFDSLTATDMNKKITNNIKTVAKNVGMTVTNSNNKLKINKNPWFNENCLSLKIKVKNAFRNYKKQGYTEELRQVYINLKAEYNSVIKQEKKNFFIELKNKISKTRNSSEFWQSINKFRNRRDSLRNPIEMSEWEKFFKDFYVTNIENIIIDDIYIGDPYLNSPVTLKEINSALDKCKTGKAAGPDQVANEFLKNLPEIWRQKIIKLFNKILQEETIPAAWSESRLTLLFKKGNRNDPNNYRGISIINTITKLFTTILTDRIHNWVDNREVIQNSQFGFRKGRGCQDAIYTLHSAISINIRHRKSKVYTVFVDFSRAFDSVPHAILWQKLHTIGISTKIINILKDFYQKANFTFIINGDTSSSININRGVLQGDSLSPSLFNLFINDLEQFMKVNNVRGVSIGKEDILLTLYADDLALITDNPVMAQKALNILALYCTKNHLNININKTKIVIFRKGGKLKNLLSFKINNQNIDIVSDYCYLGVQFSSSGLFSKATDHAIRKAIMAVYSTKNIMTKSKMCAWEARMQLFDSMVSSTLLYGAETWSLRYLSNLERVQGIFFKTVFNWPQNTPNYIIRCETGRKNIAVNALKIILNWWQKILKMNNTSLPKICYNRLIELDINRGMLPKYNWASQLRELLQNLNLNYIWEEQNPQTIKDQLENILTNYQNQLLIIDKNKILDSSYSSIYQHIIHENITYFKLNINFNKIKLISQIRVSGHLTVKLHANTCVYKWKQEDLCRICNFGTAETIMHFFLECPIYEPIRSHYLKKYFSTENNNEINYINLVSNLTIQKINEIFYYVTGALKIRSFALNE